jgi:hypothetical protein
MVDFMLSFFRRLVEVVLILVVIAGLFNFVQTPGGLTEKLKGSYEKTSDQSNHVFNAGKNVISSESVGLVRHLSSGILEKERQRTEELEFGRRG